MRTADKIVEDITKRLEKMRLNGMDMNEISKKTGYSVRMIREYIGSDTNELAQKKRERSGKITVEQLMKLRKLGMTNREIAEEMCCSVKFVRNRIGKGLQKEGDKIRPKGVYAKLHEELMAVSRLKGGKGSHKNSPAIVKQLPNGEYDDPWQACDRYCKGCAYYSETPIRCCNYFEITHILRQEQPRHCTRRMKGKKLKVTADINDLTVEPTALIMMDENLVKIKRKDKKRDAMLR